MVLPHSLALPNCPTTCCLPPFSEQEQVFQRKKGGGVKISWPGLGKSRIQRDHHHHHHHHHVKLERPLAAVAAALTKTTLVAAVAVAAALTALSPPICLLIPTPPQSPAAAAAAAGVGSGSMGQTTIDKDYINLGEKGAGSSLFRRACIGCHDAGGNIIQPVWRHTFLERSTKEWS